MCIFYLGTLPVDTPWKIDQLPIVWHVSLFQLMRTSFDESERTCSFSKGSTCPKLCDLGPKTLLVGRSPAISDTTSGWTGIPRVQCLQAVAVGSQDSKCSHLRAVQSAWIVVLRHLDSKTKRDPHSDSFGDIHNHPYSPSPVALRDVIHRKGVTVTVVHSFSQRHPVLVVFGWNLPSH